MNIYKIIVKKIILTNFYNNTNIYTFRQLKRLNIYVFLLTFPK